MNKYNKKVKLAKEKMNNWSARGDRCPICGKDFRKGCEHSVPEAEERLLENYIRAVSNSHGGMA